MIASAKHSCGYSVASTATVNAVAGGLIAAAITPHTPFLLDEAATPQRLHGVLAGCHALGQLIRSLTPDLLVINSSHWNTPFLWYVAAHPRHRGRCISDK